jgi:hypothetical protein
VHLPVGAYTVLAHRASGASFSQVVEVAAGAVVRVVVPAVDLARPPTRVADTQSSAPTWRTIGWVLLGAGAVGAGVGTYLGVRTLDARDDYAATGFTSDADYDRAAGLRAATNVAWVTSAVLAVGGATALVIAATRRTPPARSSARATLARRGTAGAR